MFPYADLEMTNTRPADVRPAALTSHVCQIMERMVNERPMYHCGLEIRSSAVDPALGSKHEIRKAQAGKKSVAAAFFWYVVDKRVIDQTEPTGDLW